MKVPIRLLCVAGLCIPAGATVQIISLTPSLQTPQTLGTSVTWRATATDSNAGPLTFQFNVAPPRGNFTNGLARDFNVGTLSAGVWTSQPFVWVPTEVEGTYQIQVVIKDFGSKESTSKTVSFQITALVTAGKPVVKATANPLVALFSTNPCPVGSKIRVSFQEQSKATPATTTNWANCRASGTMNFEIAGMYPSTTYQIFSQTDTGGVITNGPTLNFTTGALPSNIAFPTFTTIVGPGPQTDTNLKVLLRNPATSLGSPYMAVATDLSNKILWYYVPYPSAPYVLVSRPLPNGGMLSIQNGVAWNSKTQSQQIVRQTDLAGNVIRETNTGAIQQQLLALGDTNLGPCSAFSSPPPVGSSCLGAFHHDAIRLPNGYTALLADVESIFPPGTQGDTSGLPVDIIGDAIVVLNQNWQVVWAFNAFRHDGGGQQLDINRPAVMGETCVADQPGCPPMLMLGPGIAPTGKDWLHANSLYYWPKDNSGGASGDIIWSARHQDWVMKIDYNNGVGTGNILWRMGPSGDFNFNNVYNDPWPWFSHQHEVGIESNGAMTLFDNGNTRISTLGSSGCKPSDCNSRGMALTFNESTLQVTPVLSADLGYDSIAMGSAQLLADGNYFFLAGAVIVNTASQSSALEILPTSGTDTGTVVLNLQQNQESYRGWQMPSLYIVPKT